MAWPMFCQKVKKIVLPSSVTPPIAASAISAASSPYSSRSWPSSRSTRRPIAVIITIGSAFRETRGGVSSAPRFSHRAGSCVCVLRVERRRDLDEDRVDVRAGQRDRRDGHEGNQRDEQ